MTDSLAQVAGANARKLRRDANVTLDELAAAASSYGLPWTTGRVGALESGQVKPDLATLYGVAAALSRTTGRPVEIADLFAGEGEVAINGRLTVPLSALRAALTGGPVHVEQAGGDTAAKATLGGTGTLTAQAIAFPKWAHETGVDPSLYVQVLNALRESDTRMCKRLGVEAEIGAAAMAKLWGKPFSAERDHRAEPGANAQRKGQISRQLKTELLSIIRPTKREGLTE